ncbi:MAG: dTDP-4-dehydrorhamnose 3,5-epimerase [Candidatus Methanoperedenaceae archaeon]|nr:dTDP-4-dehydrorhamnose 3,5-epimerase [Candidatus Methanoperedenaceae archaeon]
MRFNQTTIKGLYIIEPDRLEDERGFFARTFCQKEFLANGLNPRLVQCSISYNKRKGTLRGMHYQIAPMAEAKLVRCTKGAIYDVSIDLRKNSNTYLQSIAFELTSDNHIMIYIPEGFAHGFQTLEDNSEVFYQMSEFYASEYAQGFRYDDPAFGIKWPLKTVIISEKDKKYQNIKI